MRISDWSSDVCSADLGGDSAGANLSVATCLLQRQRGRPQPIAMLLNYGAFAPERTPSYARFGAGDYSLESDEMDAFWATYVDGPDQLSDPLVDRKSTRLHSSH